MSESAADAELDPAAAAAVVEHCEQRLRRLGTEVGVVLECQGELVADPVGHAGRRSEMRFTEAVEVGIENGIGDQVETAEAHADEGTDLARKAAHVPLRRVVAELEVEAVEHGSIVRIGHDQQSAKLEAIEQQTAVGGSAIE